VTLILSGRATLDPYRTYLTSVCGVRNSSTLWRIDTVACRLLAEKIHEYA
jgi:hypothetical protein